MAVTAPETVARQKLKDVIDAEFTVEGFTAEHDHLHESLGAKGVRIGLSPNRSRPARDSKVLLIEILVQFFGQWKPEINPQQKVDPALIEQYAERFRRALRTGDPDQDNVWYFALSDIVFPQDPTGNKTRFEATVVAYGNNSALIETIG